MFRAINTDLFKDADAAKEFGPAPTLHWLAIVDMVVDESYQREIGIKGRANIKAIASSFEWAKFAPVIVAGVEGGKYAIVDGQHRTTAAALCGQKTVPCQVIQADRIKQAQAYAAVNGSITKTTPHQLFHARSAAGDPVVREVEDACKIAGVFVTTHNRGSSHYRIGETQAIGAITRSYRKFGRDTLITALQCITQTGDGNVGCLRSTIIEGMCLALHHRHDWRDAGTALLRAMDDFIFAEEWERAAEGRENVILSRAVSKVFFERITDHLRARLKTAVHASYREPKQVPPAPVLHA